VPPLPCLRVCVYPPPRFLALRCPYKRRNTRDATAFLPRTTFTRYGLCGVSLRLARVPDEQLLYMLGLSCPFHFAFAAPDTTNERHRFDFLFDLPDVSLFCPAVSLRTRLNVLLAATLRTVRCDAFCPFSVDVLPLLALTATTNRCVSHVYQWVAFPCIATRCRCFMQRVAYDLPFDVQLAFFLRSIPPACLVGDTHV